MIRYLFLFYLVVTASSTTNLRNRRVDDYDYAAADTDTDADADAEATNIDSIEKNEMAIVNLREDSMMSRSQSSPASIISSESINDDMDEEYDINGYLTDGYGTMARSPNDVSNEEESQFLLLDEETNKDMIPQYDSASYLIGRNPLVSGADYDDLDKEIAEEDHEEDEEDYDNDEEGYVNSVGERSFGINAQKKRTIQ